MRVSSFVVHPAWEYLVVKVNCKRGSTSLLAKGKGAHREVGSGGRYQANLWLDEIPGCQGAVEYMG